MALQLSNRPMYEREEAAAVRPDDSQAREPIQMSFENQMRERDRRIERKADVVAERTRRRRAASRHRRIPAGESKTPCRAPPPPPERIQLRVRELAAVDVGADDEAAQIEPADRVVHLLDGEVRLLERDVAETDEAVGVRGAQLGDPLVLHLHDPRGEIRLREVQELAGVDADHVDVDPLPIHLAEPAVQRAGVDGHRAGAEVRHRAIDLRQILDQRPRLLDEDVRVHVDRAHALAADRDLTARCACAASNACAADRPHGQKDENLRLPRKPEETSAGSASWGGWYHRKCLVSSTSSTGGAE